MLTPIRIPVLCSSLVLLLSCGGEPAPAPVAPVTSAAPPPIASSAPAPAAPSDPSLRGPDESAMNKSVSPCDDFFEYACGGWIKATPIPEDESSWVRSFSAIREDNQKALRDILERDAKGDTRDDAYAGKLGDFWASCMDEDAVEKRARKDLDAERKRIAAVKDVPSLVAALAHLHSVGVRAAFRFESDTDFKDAAHTIAELSQGGLGLPDRDYYFRDDASTKDIRAAYEKHVARMFELAGAKPKAAAERAKTVMRIETDLAGASMTRIERRDPDNVYHRIDLDGLKKIAPDVPWGDYLAQLGFPAITAINVAQPEFVKKLDAMAKGESAAAWRTYLEWHVLRTMAPYLSKAFVDESFHLQQALTGAKALAPRWKRCVRIIDATMGEALAQPFVKEHLGEDGRKAARSLVAGIEASMKIDIEALAWMDGATRTQAEEKLGKIANQIGYPNKWRSYDALSIERGSFVQNVMRAEAFEVKRDLSKAGKPTDRDEWVMTPPTVNAYYEPTFNEMVFPAGILQPPFYAKPQSPALNFGAIGSVIGHELTHGFDDEGRKFDADGNRRDWWSPPVGAEFERRAQCVEKQFDDYVAIDDMHVRGKLTLGENIADLGGIKLSFATFERAEREQPRTPVIAGLSPEQQFFLGFAQAWCGSYRPEAMRLQVTTNPHSPPRFRVDGPLSNLPEFAQAFSCKEGQPMARAKDKRCEVW